MTLRSFTSRVRAAIGNGLELTAMAIAMLLICGQSFAATRPEIATPMETPTPKKNATPTVTATPELKYYRVTFNNKKAGANYISGLVDMVIKAEDSPKLKTDNKIKSRCKTTDYQFDSRLITANDVDPYFVNQFVFYYATGQIVIEGVEGEKCPRR